MQNPDIPRAGRGGAAHGGAAGPGRTGRKPTGRFAQETTVSRARHGIENNCSEHFQTCRVQNPDIPRAGRVGARGGAAGRGQAGLGANRTVRPGNKGPSYPPRKR